MHMQQGLNPAALVVDFEALFTHTVSFCCLWVQHLMGWCETRTLLAGHTQAKHQSSTSISPVCCLPFSFKNLLSLLSPWFQQATYFNASNLFDQIASIVVYVCAHAHSCSHVLHQSKDVFLCVRVCVCTCASVCLACGMVHQPNRAVLWSVTFVWIGNVDLFRLKRHELESLVRTHDQKRLVALCQSTLLLPCEADVK